ncbi:hypothetical protein [Chloroflexus sp.]|uniref:hypothetical protein n=1 Tax=Chloroflexus sp. TaxID=1904827 RepID=UPI00298F17FF|nr:hypothetical protein [Chloroflexus sp.]MDW8403399.1 hypothetical protein [Chloroflexus sp.]
MAGILLGLLLIVWLIFELIGYEQHFRLDFSGVQSQVSGRTNTFLKIVRAGSLLGGRPSVMGSGLAMRTSDAIRWSQVRKVEVDERQRQILLYRGDGPPFLLLCPAEHFATAREIVRLRTGFAA